MSDPRAENCKGYRDEGGLVTGVLLHYEEIPGAKYQLISVSLIDERQQGPGGPTIAFFNVLDRNGVPTFDEKVWLAWPWPSLADGQLLPGTPGQHMVSGLPYSPPDVGPGEIHIADAQGNLISDRIGGLGLPHRHHVSYQLTYKERGGTVPPVPDPDPDPDEPPAANEEIALLREIRDAIKAGFRL